MVEKIKVFGSDAEVEMVIIDPSKRHCRTCKYIGLPMDDPKCAECNSANIFKNWEEQEDTNDPGIVYV